MLNVFSVPLGILEKDAFPSVYFLMYCPTFYSNQPTLTHHVFSGGSGQYCTENVDECELMPNACQNGGTCHDTHGSYHCVCVNGWTGDDCSENIDDCASAACYHGATCHDRVASFFCECPHGRTGEEKV